MPDAGSAVAALGSPLAPGDVVLVKASRAAGLERVALALTGEASAVKTILVAGGISLLLALFGTPLAIRVFTRRGYGQAIREEGPAGHATKRGTPTMGGTVIVIASLTGYFVGNLATGQVPSVVRPAGDDADGRAWAWSGSSTTSSRSTSSAAWACAAAPSWPARRWSARCSRCW